MDFVIDHWMLLTIVAILLVIALSFAMANKPDESDTIHTDEETGTQYRVNRGGMKVFVGPETQTETQIEQNEEEDADDEADDSFDLLYPGQSQFGAIDDLSEKFPDEIAALTKPIPLEDGRQIALRTHNIKVPALVFSESLTFVYSFDVPEDFDATRLTDSLKNRVPNIITNYVQGLNQLTRKPKFDPLEVTDRILIDSLEYVLTLRSAEEAYNANPAYFRFHVHVQRSDATRQGLYVGDDME